MSGEEDSGEKDKKIGIGTSQVVSTSRGSPTAEAPVSIGRGPASAEFLCSGSIPLWNRSDETILIGLVDECSFTRECIVGFLRGLGGQLKFLPFATCEECAESAGGHDLILYHTMEKTQSNGTAAFSKMPILTRIAPVIILSAVDSHDLMLEAYQSGAHGFISTVSTTAMQVVEIIRLVKAGGIFVPPGSLSLRRISASTYQFTPRELDVLERLMRGKTNKAIAYELQMSETTVKVHIRRIMEKLKAKNRTEVVYRAFNFSGIRQA